MNDICGIERCLMSPRWGLVDFLSPFLGLTPQATRLRRFAALRTAHDLNILPVRLLEHAFNSLVELGRLLGAWRAKAAGT